MRLEWELGIFSGLTFKKLSNIETNPPFLTQLGDLNTARYCAKMVVHEDYVFIFGGYNHNSGNLSKAEVDQIRLVFHRLS